MKKILLFATLFLLAGCSTTDVLLEDEGAVLTNGRIVRKVGQLNCRMTVVTDRYGIFETGNLQYEDCARFHEGDRVRIKINQGLLELMYPLDRYR